MRQKRSAEFKNRVELEALKEEKTLNEIAKKVSVNDSQGDKGSGCVR